MTDPKWSEPAKKEIEAKPDVLWVRVVDYIHGPRKVKIEATGTWSYAPRSACGPDGNVAEGFDDGHLLKTAARGCLIAKVGGSAGDTPGSEKIQAVGSFAIFEIGDTGGALFLAMKDKPQNWDRHSGKLEISISDAS